MSAASYGGVGWSAAVELERRVENGPILHGSERVCPRIDQAREKSVSLRPDHELGSFSAQQNTARSVVLFSRQRGALITLANHTPKKLSPGQRKARTSRSGPSKTDDAYRNAHRPQHRLAAWLSFLIKKTGRGCSRGRVQSVDSEQTRRPPQRQQPWCRLCYLAGRRRCLGRTSRSDPTPPRGP